MARPTEQQEPILTPSSTNNKPNVLSNLQVVNLSSRNLTKRQIELLKKRLKFTPTPKKNIGEIKTDIKDFCRKLRNKEYFQSQELNEENESLVRNKSNFCPPRNKNKPLNNYT